MSAVKKQKTENGSATTKANLSVDSSPEGKTVFVGGLSFDADEEAVKEFFGAAGEINSVRIPVFEDSGKPRGIAFLEFATGEAAQKAVEMDGQEMMGRWLKVSISTSPAARSDNKAPRRQGLSEKPDNCTTIFVGNLSWNASEDDLREAFSACGEVVGVRIAMDQESGRSKGFGHVEFTDSSAVDEAVKMTGTNVAGREIRVDYGGQRKGGWGWLRWGSGQGRRRLWG